MSWIYFCSHGFWGNGLNNGQRSLALSWTAGRVGFPGVLVLTPLRRGQPRALCCFSRVCVSSEDAPGQMTVAPIPPFTVAFLEIGHLLLATSLPPLVLHNTRHRELQSISATWAFCPFIAFLSSISILVSGPSWK